MSPVEEEEGLVIMVHGDKGDGKTVLALSVVNDGDSVAALSFDQQTNIIKKNIYGKNPKITVFDATRYYSSADQNKMLERASDTYDYILKLIDGPIKPL